VILFENLLISFKLFLVVFLFILSRRLSFLLSLGFTEGLAPTFFSLSNNNATVKRQFLGVLSENNTVERLLVKQIAQKLTLSLQLCSPFLSF